MPPPPAVRRAPVFGMVAKPLSTSFDAGVDLRDVQIAAHNADPRTTIRHYAPVRTSTAIPTTSSPPTSPLAPDQLSSMKRDRAENSALSNTHLYALTCMLTHALRLGGNSPRSVVRRCRRPQGDRISPITRGWVTATV
jgi:hypothetical protein